MKEIIRKFRESDSYDSLKEILGGIVAIILGFGLALLILLIGIAEGWQM